MSKSDFEIANELKRQGKLEDAISNYHLVIEKNPTFCWSYYQLGEILEQTSELNEAVYLYRKCIELNPNSSWLHYKLGLALSKLEKQSDAISNLEKAVRINPLPLYKNALDDLTLKSNKSSIAPPNPKKGLQNQDINDQEFIAKYSNCLGDEAFINKAYLEYLKCQPTTQDLDNYQQSLNDGSLSNLEVILSLRQSPEFIKNNCSQIEIVSVHIEKTAGTLFGNLLQQIYGEDFVYRDYSNIPLQRRGKMSINTKVIHGHISAHKYKNILPSAKMITWLRHPVHRLVSLFYFWANSPVGLKHIKDIIKTENININDFVKKHRNVVSNILTQTRLDDFYFVGIQEYLQEDLEDLTEMLNWPPMSTEGLKENKNPYSNYNIERDQLIEDQEWFNYVASLNDEDMQIYKTALDIREKRRKN